MPASYSLGKHFETFVQGQVRSGRYASASEVVRDGLRLMEEREAERNARLDALRAEMERGRESGPGIAADIVFKDVRDRAAKTRFVQEQPVSPVTREQVVERLRAHEAELKDMGVERLSLFGSVARGEARAGSDVDLAAELDRSRKIDLFHYGAIAERLEALLGVKVDLLTEPARKPRMQAEIDRDRVNVF
ncbi:MAG TPA: type II toxin-antitoxin system ParD family antitoxin [Allosphingosinicella sp.]|jgi:hypothetical protein|uniref:type II toxin-antitoxin system ParD family antitoxin n=1 Tax=Allosphingosinicella sp. TaxID=2823234 RepID=UPI002F27D04B